MNTTSVSFKLTSLWKEVLSIPPSSNLSELWKEHIQIRSVLAEVSATQKPWIRPDRTKSLERFLKWSSEMAIRHDGVDITSSVSGYLSLTVSKVFDKEALIVDVPREAVLSLDFADQCFSLRAIFENDEMIKAMDNVGLVMVLAHEVIIGEESNWSPYLNILPNLFTTPLFYTLEQLQTLKPSPIFEDALNMYRSVVSQLNIVSHVVAILQARQFVYFYLRILGDSKHVNKKKKLSTADKAPFSLGPFTPENFSFEFYRWCVSVVSTRINMLPSTTKNRKRGKQPDLVPSLIPIIDLANHGQSVNESGSIFFDSESNAVHLQIHTTLQPNQEVLIYYGVRTNLKFLLHNGFVPPLPNPHNTYDIKFGSAYVDPDGHCQSIATISRFDCIAVQDCPNRLTNVYHFVLEPCQRTLHASFLFKFACAFVAQTREQLENGVEQKASKFLTDRFHLLLLGYRDLPNNEPTGIDDTTLSVWRLKKSEKEILQSYLQCLNKEK